MRSEPVTLSGATLNGVLNGAWVTHTDPRLSAGTYTLRGSKLEVLACDAEGNLDVAMITRPAKPKMYYFTGTYPVNMDVAKTNTPMGQGSALRAVHKALDLEETAAEISRIISDHLF